MLLRKTNSSIMLIVTIFIFFVLGCSSESSSNTEATDPEKNDSLNVDTLSVREESNSEGNSGTVLQTLNLEMNDFEKSILEATEEGLYLVQTEEGFDYIKTDINNDGFDDAIALIVHERTPDMYDLENTVVMIMVFQTLGDGTLIQSGGRSGNLGRESICYKSFKKLKWENETLTYTHQSMRNDMEVNIKVKGSFEGATVDKVSICYYDLESGCKDLYVASEKETLELIELNKELLNELIYQ